jgi:hypothetical protein
MQPSIGFCNLYCNNRLSKSSGAGLAGAGRAVELGRAGRAGGLAGAGRGLELCHAVSPVKPKSSEEGFSLAHFKIYVLTLNVSLIG